MYRWEVGDYKRTQELLVRIEPFLSTKKEQARLGIEMSNILRENPRPENYKKTLIALAQKISQLNESKVPPEFDW